MTAATRITCVRLLLIPAFVVAVAMSASATSAADGAWWWAAVAVAAVAAVTDLIDGTVARWTGSVTASGAILDPIADKVSMAAGLVALKVWETAFVPIPLWYVVLVIGKDAALAVGGAVMMRRLPRGSLKAGVPGKVAVALQTLVLFAALLRWPQVRWVVWPAAVGTVWAGAWYATWAARTARRVPS